MSTARVEESRSVIRSARRIPFYFLIASAGIACLATIQYVMLDHMPVWNDHELNMPSHRMIGFDTSVSGEWAAAEYYTLTPSQTGGVSVTLSMFNTCNTREKLEFTQPDLMQARMSPCGKFVALAGERSVRICTTHPDVERFDFLAQQLGGIVRDVDWSNDCAQILVRMDHQAQLWDVNSRRMLRVLEIDPLKEVVCPREVNCFIACMNKQYSVFDWSTGNQLRDLPIDLDARSIASSHDLRYLAIIVGDSLTILETGANRSPWSCRYKVPLSCKNAMAFSPDGRHLAVLQVVPGVCQDYAVKVFEIASEKEVGARVFSAHDVTGIHFAANDALWVWNASGAISSLDCRLESCFDSNSLLVEQSSLHVQYD